MANDTFNIFSKKPWSRDQSLFIVIVMVALTALGYSLTSRWDTYSRASSNTGTISENLGNIVPPKTGLAAPYIRLVAAPQPHAVGDIVPVEVYAHTEGKPTVEADATILYDPTVIRLGRGQAKAASVYSSIQIDEATPGRAVLSLFTPEGAGFKPVILTREAKVATLYFTVLANPQTNTVLSVVRDATPETSGLLLPREGSTTSQNILRFVDGATLVIR